MDNQKLNPKTGFITQVQGWLGIKKDGEFPEFTNRNTPKVSLEDLLTTDVQWAPKKIQIIEHFLPSGEYINETTKKEWVFLHHTAGWNNPGKTIDNWGRDDRGRIGTEFVLGGQNVKDCDDTYDGELLQAFPTGKYAWHLGTGSKKLHSCSVGIEVCNFGYIKDGKTYSDTIAHGDQIVTLAKSFRGYKHWHKYSDKQLEVLKQWILFIAERDNIDVRKGLIELVHKKGADAFDHFDLALVEKTKGLWTHTNARKDKSDMSPQPNLIDMLLSI